VIISNKRRKALKNRVSILSRIPFFSDLTQDQLGEIDTIALHRTFNKGEVIFFEGDDSNGFFVIVDGLVKVFKVSAEGKEQILHVFGPGEPIGEVSVFSGQQFPAHAEAIAESQLLFFPRAAFVDLIAANPPIALSMLAVLSKRLRQFTVQVEHLSLKEVPGRLAAYLLYLADEQGKEDLVTLTISKGQLASLLGTIPETLSRIFARMASQKLIEVRASSIRLLDRSGLEELAERGKHGE
jgi:CRP-like cAMP-binding protein